MDDTQAKLGHMLLKGLVSVREQKGAVSLEDVGSMFMQMASSLPTSGSITDQFMHQEIGRLAQYINDAKKEIFSISANEKTNAALTDASQHLDEVIKATEHASHSIMDAADAIQKAAGGIGGEKEKQIMDSTNLIYEACNFQDITGQRITKVMKLLSNIDESINKLNALFGADGAAAMAMNKEKVVPISGKDSDLLNGPQLTGQGASQAEIDALFASLSGKN